MNWRFPIQTALMAATVMTGASAMAAQYPPEIDRDPVLHERLEAAYTAKGPDYAPRTHLFDNGRARYVNRLIEEASPYLIQHAHNPVDWHPWSDETLAKAAAAGKPIFLSVGYATCHWCHVMEEESFDHEGVAALLNRHFIAIKIDREEMPELDHLYITATQLQQGHAGWPNSLWLMPDGRPFHTGTYFPREQFTEIAAAIGQAWSDPQQRLQIDEVAGQLSGAVQQITQMASTRSVVLGETVFTRAAESLLRMHNALQGGFSDAQQFPQEGFLLYLLDHWRRTGEEASLQVATETLYAIAAGGIHDHVGGGFHRYTVDPNWRTPHFEKMLYNQGLLARTFVEAWEITGEPAFRRAAERTFGYVARDMTDPDGAFYAAEDADSLNAAGEREEGAFYAFTPGQLAAVAGEAAIAMLGVDAHPTIEAGAVVHLDPQAETDFAELAPVLEAARQAREQRPRPLRDDKVIAGWNGLMIRALADGSAAFGAPHYADLAALAGETVWTRLWDGERLQRLWAGGEAREEGALEDYAWLGLAYLALHDATGDAKWIERARTLSEAMWARFEDGQGRLRMAAADGPLGPIYDSADGAVPSGESSALELLARLSHRNAGPGGETVHNTAIDRHRAETLRASLSAPMAENPLLRPDALTASRILDEGTTGRRRTAGRGVVQVHLLPDRLAFDIAPGWHLNAHEPGQDWLIGVALSGAEATWPVGESVTLGFSEDRLNVYSGRLSAPLAASPAGEIALTVQACSDSLCLEPETLIFRLP